MDKKIIFEDSMAKYTIIDNSEIINVITNNSATLTTIPENFQFLNQKEVENNILIPIEKKSSTF